MRTGRRWSRRGSNEAVLFAFDLLEQDGNDLRDLPLHERKQRLPNCLKAQRRQHPAQPHYWGSGEAEDRDRFNLTVLPALPTIRSSG